MVKHSCVINQNMLFSLSTDIVSKYNFSCSHVKPFICPRKYVLNNLCVCPFIVTTIIAKITVSGVTIYVIAWMLQTRCMAPSLIYKVSYFFRKNIQMGVKTKQCRRCLTSHLNRIYNGLALKCRCLCNHSPANIEARDC